VGNGESLSAYFSPGEQWTAEPSSVLLEGSICKRPAIPNMPARYNGSALNYSSAHDPTMLKTPDGQYVVYATNMNIPGSISNDHKTFYFNGTAFPEGLPWTLNWTHGQKCYWVFDSEGRRTVAAADNVSTCLWCPDTSYHNGKYWMYYAASVLYTKVGAIGLATSPTGRPGDWTDHGPVFNSVTANYSAIDPNLFVDDDGTFYLTFGSFNSGIWQYEMDPNTGFIKEGTQIVKLASERSGGIEASGLWKKG
jgi:arabinan endo-1,5-alpha-L-arabinosidase